MEGFEPRTLVGSVGWLYLGPTTSQPSHLTIMTWDDDGAMAMVEGKEGKGKGVGFALSLCQVHHHRHFRTRFLFPFRHLS